MKRTIAAGIIFSILAFAAYVPALNNPLLFDDETLIKGNANLVLSRVTSLFGPGYFNFFPGQAVSWRPVSTLTYILNNTLWGDGYRWWRLVYLSLHALNATLLFALFSLLAFPPVAAFGAGAVFLLHPVHSELINQVSYNEDIVMTTFLLAATLLFVRGRRGECRWWRPGVVLGYALALLTKESSLFFPLVLAVWILAESAPAGGERPGRRDEASLALAMSIVAACFLAVRFWLIRNPLEDPSRLLGGIEPSRAAADIFRVLALYLARFLYPRGWRRCTVCPPSHGAILSSSPG